MELLVQEHGKTSLTEWQGKENDAAAAVGQLLGEATLLASHLSAFRLCGDNGGGGGGGQHCSKPIDQHAACSADSRTFAKRSGGSRELDTRAGDEDFDRSSKNATDIANISNGAWCLVKRNDGSWKYGTLSERKASSFVVVLLPHVTFLQKASLLLRKTNGEPYGMRAVMDRFSSFFRRGWLGGTL
jgi:hypothetical protein